MAEDADAMECAAASSRRSIKLSSKRNSNSRPAKAKSPATHVANAIHSRVRSALRLRAGMARTKAIAEAADSFDKR